VSQQPPGRADAQANPGTGEAAPRSRASAKYINKRQRLLPCEFWDVLPPGLPANAGGLFSEGNPRTVSAELLISQTQQNLMCRSCYASFCSMTLRVTFLF